ncbi:hypothetical protein [Leisingera sp. JC11]|uniref:hypothetical protein n=1 Tax=Leisingera sp. JC11 TaxID=3042469 RepID=UPI003453F970
MKRLGLIAIHGMGETKEDFADAFFAEIRSRLGAAQSEKLVTEPVYYQNILQENQEKYFNRVRQHIDWMRLRKFMLYGICDAASLESRKDGPDSPYFIAQTRILEAFRRVYRALEGSNRRVIVVAQSLGGQVLSNYLWDASRASKPAHGVWSGTPGFASPEEEEFCRGNFIARLNTTGCNIPVFVAGRDREDIKPIPRPNSYFEWHNFYDEDDVLGWPLRDLSDSYAALVEADHRINSGGLLTSFNPLSHSNYWDDRSFLRPLLDQIRQHV